MQPSGTQAEHGVVVRSESDGNKSVRRRTGCPGGQTVCRTKDDIITVTTGAKVWEKSEYIG